MMFKLTIMDSQFDTIKDEFLRIWAYYNPTNASSEGWREFAGNIPDHRLEKIETYLFALSQLESELQEIDFDNLSREDQLDYELILNKIDSERLNYDILQSPTDNPLFYTDAAFIFDYLLKDYAPITSRLKQLILHLKQLSEYYRIARENLIIENIAPELADMTVSMLSGMAEFLNNILDETKALDENMKIPSELESDLVTVGSAASKAIMDYVTYLKSAEKEFNSDFRLGKEKYQLMLKYAERVDLPIEEILEAGEKNLERNLAEFRKAASQIDPDKGPQEIIADIKKSHPTTESLVADTQAMLEEIRTFLIEQEFVSVPTEIMPKVVYTPKPFREWAFAAMNTPGALEKKATDSYYYVTPPGEDWTEQEKEDWLQTFNYAGLLDICVHEAFPGHYLHHLHNQRSKYLMSKLFGAYHFWEGYALYVEEAMWEHGFQKGDHKYRMAQLVETLLRNVRLINSIKLHTDPDYTVEDATQLFMDKVFMGRKPAEAEAKRGTYDPGYLNYALGKLMIEKLREDYKEEKGDQYSIKEFHDTLLSFGAPPIPILRKYMLKNTEIHNEIL